MNHQLAEAVIIVTVIIHRRIFAGPRARRFLGLQLDVLGRTPVALDNQRMCNVSEPVFYLYSRLNTENANSPISYNMIIYLFAKFCLYNISAKFATIIMQIVDGQA